LLKHSGKSMLFQGVRNNSTGILCCDIARDLWNLVYRMFGAKTGGGALGALEKEGLVKRILMLFGM
jgi:hypothetical protein